MIKIQLKLEKSFQNQFQQKNKKHNHQNQQRKVRKQIWLMICKNKLCKTIHPKKCNNLWDNKLMISLKMRWMKKWIKRWMRILRNNRWVKISKMILLMQMMILSMIKLRKTLFNNWSRKRRQKVRKKGQQQQPKTKSLSQSSNNHK